MESSQIINRYRANISSCRTPATMSEKSALRISLFLSKDQSKWFWLFVSYFCVGSNISLLWQFCDQERHLQKRNMPHSSKRCLSISYLCGCNLFVLKYYLCNWRSIVFPFLFWNLVFIFTSPSARAGYDTRSVIKRSLTGLNSEFSFS